MQNKTTVTLMLGWVLVLTGCTTTNEVLFVTKTSVGIDFDAKPATASIGYDRTEGYIAPRYDNGEIPPVVASIKSDVAIFSPNIRQVYATGDAAVIAVSAYPKKALEYLDPFPGQGTPPLPVEDHTPEKKLRGDKKLMFFGTSTTTGLKVGFSTAVPDSFSFGYKRKEYSFIPVGTVVEGDNEYDVYPSVLASIDTRANVSTKGVIDQTGLSSSQFFATGRAARKLAANPGVNQAFRKLATQSLRAEQAAAGEKHDTAVKEEGNLKTRILAKFKTALDDIPNTAQAFVEKANEIAKKETGGYDPKGTPITIVNFEKKLPQLNKTELSELNKSIQDDGQVIGQ